MIILLSQLKQMNYLFKNGVRRIFKSLQLSNVSSEELRVALRSKGVYEVGSFIYHRLPREQIKQLTKIPCPINSSPEENLQLIKQCKSIRASFNTNEQIICSKCPYENSCPQSKQKGSQNQIDAAQDILNYLQALENYSEPSKISFRVWTSGYKVCDNILALIEDLKNDGQQALAFERARLQYLEEQEEIKKQEAKNQNEDTERKNYLKQKKQKSKKPKRFQSFESQEIPNNYAERPRRRKDKQVQFSAKNHPSSSEQTYPQRNIRRRPTQDAYPENNMRRRSNDRYSQQNMRRRSTQDIHPDNNVRIKSNDRYSQQHKRRNNEDRYLQENMRRRNRQDPRFQRQFQRKFEKYNSDFQQIQRPKRQNSEQRQKRKENRAPNYEKRQYGSHPRIKISKRQDEFEQPPIRKQRPEKNRPIIRQWQQVEEQDFLSRTRQTQERSSLSGLSGFSGSQEKQVRRGRRVNNRK